MLKLSFKRVLNQKSHSCQFLQYGIVSYKDMKAGVALLNKSTIDAMLPSLLGVPVTILHPGTDEAIAEEKVGSVTAVRWNGDTGWYECDFEIDDGEDEAEKLINDGYSVSCGFNVSKTGKGGDWHSIKYDEEILEGIFTHLALVPNPRYEDSEIFALQNAKVYVNSKEAEVQRKKNSYMPDPEFAPKCDNCKAKCVEKILNVTAKDWNGTFCSEGCMDAWKTEHRFNSTQPKKETNPMFLFLKKLIKKDGQEVEESRKINAVETSLEIDGQSVPMKELIATYKAEQEEVKAKEEMLAMENEVEDTDGNKFKVGDLVDCYRKKKGASQKKNEGDDEEKKKKEEEAKKNADEEKKKKEEEEKAKKENAKKEFSSRCSRVGLEEPVEENVLADAERKLNARAKKIGLAETSTLQEVEKEEEKIHRENSDARSKRFKLINDAGNRNESEDKGFHPVPETMQDKIARGKQLFGQVKKN